MNVLITGYSGFLGREVVNLLNLNQYNLIFVGRKKIKRKNFIFCNINNLKKFTSILNNLKIDVIINLAAEVNFHKKTKNIYKVNASCPHLIARYCKKKIFILFTLGTIINGLHKTYSKRTNLNL